VFGSPNGRTIEAIQKANTINKSKNGPFDLMILLGDCFPPDMLLSDIDDLVSGKIAVDIPTYFSSASVELHELVTETLSTNDGQLCRNLNYLGKSGRLTTSEGLTLACAHSSGDLGSTKPVDILFTSEWPKGVQNVPNSVPLAITIEQNEAIARIAQQLKPRYHMVCVPGKNCSWERPPYLCDEGRITRFISLADFGASTKWFYAFGISRTDTSSPPLGTTSDPYAAANENNTPGDVIWGSVPPKRPASPDLGRRRGRKMMKHTSVNPESCFFCLSNPKLDRALITSIADECYLALAKGPLSSPNVREKLGCPGHVLIIPVAHVPTYKAISPESINAALLERKKFLVALGQMYAEQGLSYVTFEISRSRGVHVHTQVVPVPQDYVEIVRSSFMEEGTKTGISFHDRDLRDGETEYVRIEFPQSCLTAELDPRLRFDLQFCRRVLATALGIEEQIDWRQCSQSPKEEQRDNVGFKKIFKSFDFTL
jgi:diadenosine tetraphosphate (Ap4A) HIT family hydrolase